MHRADELRHPAAGGGHRRPQPTAPCPGASDRPAPTPGRLPRAFFLAAVTLLLAAMPAVPAFALPGAQADPAAPPTDPPRPEIAAPPWESWTSGFVTTRDGVRIHYFETGPRDAAPTPARPALLFVPGLTIPAQIWEHQVEHFARTHRVVAMDPRSQGLSDQPRDGHYPEARGRDVKAVIDALGLAPVVPVCWSLAVAECVSVVDQFGTGDLAGLVLVDGLAGGEYDPDVAPLMLAWTGRMMRNREALTAGFVRSMYMTPQSPEYLEQVGAWSMQTPTDAVVALFVGGLTNDNRAVLERIDRPVLFTVARSPYLAAYQEMRDRIPDVRFEIFDAGHALFVDRADDFNAVLAEWLADPAARGAGDGTPAAGAAASTAGEVAP